MICGDGAWRWRDAAAGRRRKDPVEHEGTGMQSLQIYLYR